VSIKKSIRDVRGCQKKESQKVLQERNGDTYKISGKRKV